MFINEREKSMYFLWPQETELTQWVGDAGHSWDLAGGGCGFLPRMQSASSSLNQGIRETQEGALRGQRCTWAPSKHQNYWAEKWVLHWEPGCPGSNPSSTRLSVHTRASFFPSLGKTGL